MNNLTVENLLAMDEDKFYRLKAELQERHNDVLKEKRDLQGRIPFGTIGRLVGELTDEEFGALEAAQLVRQDAAALAAQKRSQDEAIRWRLMSQADKDAHTEAARARNAAREAELHPPVLFDGPSTDDILTDMGVIELVAPR